MKMIKILAVTILSVTLFSCKKDPDPVSVTKETPVKSTLTAKIVVDDTSMLTPPSGVESGYRIHCTKAGKFTQLGLMFATAGEYKVSLWNYTTKELLASAVITINDITKFIYADIPDVTVIANTKYVISVSNGTAKPYYVFRKKPLVDVSIYPFSTGSVVFESAQYKVSATSVFPEGELPEYEALTGVPDVVFEY